MKKVNYLVMFSSLFFACGFLGRGQEEVSDLNIKLTGNNTVPTASELDAFYEDYKDEETVVRGMKMLHYIDDSSKTYVCGVGVGDENIWEDAMGMLNHEVTPNAPDITFQKGYIYLFDPYDGEKETGSDLSISAESFFKGLYGIDLQAYGEYYYLYNLDFQDGEYTSFDDLSERDIRCFNYLDSRMQTVFDLDDFNMESDVFGFIPSRDFTVTKLNEPTTYFKNEICLYYEGHNEPYNYSSDAGLIIYRYRQTIQDTDYASITGPTFVIDVDHPKTIDEIKSELTATDMTDGDITNKIQIVSTNYKLVDGKIKTGIYTLKVSVSDNAGNETVADFNIVVEDIVDPTITTNDRMVSYTDTLHQEDYLALFDYFDNYNSKNELSFFILDNEYESAEPFKTFKAGIGTYHVTAKVIDKADNETTKVATITVVDNIIPRITVEHNIQSTTTNPISIDTIRSKIDVEDMVDGRINYVLTDIDKYQDNMLKVGTYKFNISATDNSNNHSSLDFNVIVNDTDQPVISYKTNYLIVVSESDRMTKDKIIEILTNVAKLTNFTVLEVNSDYFTDEELDSGSYKVVLKGIDLDNHEKVELEGDISFLSKLSVSNETIIPTKNVFEEYGKEVVMIIAACVIISLSIIVLFYPRKKND